MSNLHAEGRWELYDKEGGRWGLAAVRGYMEGGRWGLAAVRGHILRPIIHPLFYLLTVERSGLIGEWVGGWV